jgi:hypothetical protein
VPLALLVLRQRSQDHKEQLVLKVLLVLKGLQVPLLLSPVLRALLVLKE